jgi:hypothetical protein
MIDEEIYILTKHAKFQADYVTKLPIYRRRHFLRLLEKENEEIQKIRDREINKSRKPR